MAALGIYICEADFLRLIYCGHVEPQCSLKQDYSQVQLSSMKLIPRHMCMRLQVLHQSLAELEEKVICFLFLIENTECLLRFQYFIIWNSKLYEYQNIIIIKRAGFSDVAYFFLSLQWNCLSHLLMLRQNPKKRWYKNKA